MERKSESWIKEKDHLLNPCFQHPYRKHQVDYKDCRYKPVLLQIRFILSVRRQHINNLDLTNSTDIKQSNHEETDCKKANCPKNSIGEQCPCQLITMTIGSEQHSGHKLRTQHTKSNTNSNRYSPHQKSFCKKEPADCFLLHPHNRLYGKFLLLAPQHIAVYIAYQEQ